LFFAHPKLNIIEQIKLKNMLLSKQLTVLDLLIINQ